MRLILIILAYLTVLTDNSNAFEFSRDPEHLTSRIQIETLDNSSLGSKSGDIARIVLPLALDLMKDFEQWRPLPYEDSASFCTIGYGHLVARATCDKSIEELLKFAPPISIVDGDILFEKDTEAARSAVSRLVTTQLNDEQFGALTSFVFNVGIRSFSNSTLLKFLNNNEFEGATTQFKRWIMAGGKISDGLIARRACEAALFAGNLRYRNDQKFYRDDCGELGAASGTEAPIDIDVGEQL